MKRLLCPLFALSFVLFPFTSTQAQNTDISGNWSGMLELPTVKLEVIFKITETDGEYEVKMDVPLQGAANIEGQITTENDSIQMKIPRILGMYTGKFTSADYIEGKWQQSGLTLDLNLKRTKVINELKRPQTPEPPYPYLSEEVKYTNPKSGLKLAGTLTLPKDAQTCPAVVMISGSGAQDRDETIFGHKPFAVIADYLTRQGIAVLRVDDRGIGGSEGNISSSTSEDFATDVLAGVDFLKTRKEINPKEIGLIGHSEGGLIAPIVAAGSKDVAFIVLLAGPGETGEQILYEQNDLSLKAAGMPDYAIQQNKMVQKLMFDVLKNESDPDKAAEQLRTKLTQGMYEGMSEENKKLVDAKINSVNSPWFRHFLTYNPKPTLARVKCPVLALNGNKDVQVPVSNLQEIYQAVTSGGNMQVDTLSFENHNHLFQHCTSGAVAEYAQIEETIDPGVLKSIRDWILKTISK
ncbi:alpha/beta hydrolase [Maribellus sp. YY47]|uniref:alpha/beta hydrolase family protein n=1 Tax=Maribellus sp. YY47 TaxID=2929486 RepID=UPI002000DAFF|nr:alpha/beta hydrolase [Maribellus sp. YY47]MCK3686253.1 alpha/beta fold hydrolase [Maribellus sp. YY47]